MRSSSLLCELLASLCCMSVRMSLSLPVRKKLTVKETVLSVLCQHFSRLVEYNFITFGVWKFQTFMYLVHQSILLYL